MSVSNPTSHGKANTGTAAPPAAPPRPHLIFPPHVRTTFPPPTTAALSSSSSSKGHFRTHSRSPSRSPARMTKFQTDEMDPLLSDLSPHRILEALSSINGSPIASSNDRQTALLQASIARAGPAERAFGARAALAAKKLRDWCAEIEAWDWPQSKEKEASSRGFETPSEEERARKRRKIGVDEREEFWGSLPAKMVREYERRLEEIEDDMEHLDVEELKIQVLDAHNRSRSKPSSSHDPSRESFFNAYTQLDDFTALTTATVLQALPNLFRLADFLSTWTVRVNILRQIPQFLSKLEKAQKMMKSGWDAIQPKQTVEVTSIGSDVEEEFGLMQNDFNTLKVRIGSRVTTVGQQLDHILDSLEGREETVPDAWIDEAERMEAEYGDWTVQAERKVVENELRKRQVYEQRRREEEARRQEELERQREERRKRELALDLERHRRQEAERQRQLELERLERLEQQRQAEMEDLREQERRQQMELQQRLAELERQRKIEDAERTERDRRQEMQRLQHFEQQRELESKQRQIREAEERAWADVQREAEGLERLRLQREEEHALEVKRAQQLAEVERASELEKVSQHPPHVQSSKSSGPSSRHESPTILPTTLSEKAPSAEAKEVMIKETQSAQDNLEQASEEPSKDGGSAISSTSDKSDSPPIAHSLPSPHTSFSEESFARTDGKDTTSQVQPLETALRGITLSEQSKDDPKSEVDDVQSISGLSTSPSEESSGCYSSLSSPKLEEAFRAEYLQPEIVHSPSRRNRARAESIETARPTSQMTDKTVHRGSEEGSPVYASSPARIAYLRSRQNSFVLESHIPEDAVADDKKVEELEFEPRRLIEFGPELRLKSRRASTQSIESFRARDVKTIEIRRADSPQSMRSPRSHRPTGSDESATTPIKTDRFDMEQSAFHPDIDSDLSDVEASPSVQRQKKILKDLPNSPPKIPVRSPQRRPSSDAPPLMLKKLRPLPHAVPSPKSFHDLNVDSGRSRPQSPLSLLPVSTTRHVVSSDPLEQKISSILTTLPTKIQLTTEAEAVATVRKSAARAQQAQAAASSRARASARTPEPPVRSRNITPRSSTASPAFALSPVPAQTSTFRSTASTNTRPRPSNPPPISTSTSTSSSSDIKLYHLHSSTSQSAPIKLFVRLVGENGERVMVRVGGGWADLAEYLRDYALHHGGSASRKSQDSTPQNTSSSSSQAEPRIEISDFPVPPPSLPGGSRVGSRSGTPVSASVTLSHMASPAGSAERPASALASQRPSLTPQSAQPRGQGMGMGQRSVSALAISRPSPGATSSSPQTPSSLSLPLLGGGNGKQRGAVSETPSPAADDRGEKEEVGTPSPTVPLGLAGPTARKRAEGMSSEKRAWVEGVIGQVRRVSAEKGWRRPKGEEDGGRKSRSGTPVEWGELGRVEGVRRVFRKG